MRPSPTRFSVIIALAIVVSACTVGGGSTGSQTSGTRPSATTAGPRPGLTAADLKGLGSFTGTLDTAHAATRRFFGDGTPASISVTDPSGLVWTLTLPPGALLEPETITMTAFSQVRSEPGTPQITSGVSFEPDGLIFFVPATLSVTAPAGAHAPVLLTGRADGSGLAWGIGTAPGSIALPHFSAGAASPWPPDVNAMVRELENAKAESSALLKQPNPPPQLDSISKEPLAACPPAGQTSEQADAAEKARVKADGATLGSFGEPEVTLAQRLLGDSRTLALVGQTPESVLPLVSQLVARVRDRALAAITFETGRPDHGRDVAGPLARLLLGLERTIALLGGQDEIPAALVSWLRLLIQDQVNDLKAHDYDAFRRGLVLLRTLALLSNANGTDPSLKEFFDLLRFKVTIDLSMSGGGNGGNVDEVAQIVATVGVADAGPFLSDSAASGAYSSGSITRPGSSTANKVVPDSFNSTIKTTWPDVCGMRMGVAADPWGKTSEAFKTDQVTVQITANGAGLLGGCVHVAFGALEEKGTAEVGFPALFFTLNNKSATAVDDTKSSNCAGGGSSYKMTLKVKMEHLA